MPMVTVMLEDGHPVQVPLRRTLAVPSGETSSSSQSPPSICSAGRIPLRASWTRRISDAPGFCVASTPIFLERNAFILPCRGMGNKWRRPCWRFPERNSPLRPYFTREEIQVAIARGISPDAFPDHTGSKVAVVPQGEGYRCPAFQAETGRCGIYEDRPLDCRLYPVAVMWGREHADVVMGWDSKCPFIRDNLESAESRAYVERTAAFLESQEAVQVFISNQQLIGSYQDDVIVLRRLDRLTQGLRTASQLGLTVARVPEPPLRPLALTDRPRFEAALAAH